MTTADMDMKDMIARAEKMAAERDAIEVRNKKRKAKGRKPLPDYQTQKDEEVLRYKYRTGDATTVDGASALAIYERRKAEMAKTADDDDDDDVDEEQTPSSAQKPETAAPDAEAERLVATILDSSTERAIREAEAARRVQDMKNGRIDHGSNWSPEGQKLEGGDETSMPSTPPVAYEPETEPGKPKAKAKAKVKPMMPAAAGLNEFREDLYNRLRVSFEGLESTLSDLQGRVAEIVTASTPPPPEDKDDEDDSADEFKALLERKTPVVFDVAGTRMAFDAITVFHAPPCITVVSKIGSAQIMPKPGAQLFLTYEMDGQKYEKDPVTFLGTRFDLPMFGLSFVGFIRDRESDMMDVDAS